MCEPLLKTLPYLRPKLQSFLLDPKCDTLFMSGPLSQYPVVDQSYNLFPSSDQWKAMFMCFYYI